MTAIKAINCEVSAICSNARPFLETVGNKALLVNPKNEQEIKNAILEALDRKDQFMDLNDSNSIAQDYSWNETIRNYVRLYETLLWG